jgi:hypothetical protein
MPNVLYKIYFSDDKMFGAKICGQFYDMKSTTNQLSIFGLPFVRFIEKKRKAMELEYDNTPLNEYEFLKKSKDNFILSKSDIDTITFKESSMSLWILDRIYGTFSIFLKNNKVIKLIVLDDQNIEEIKMSFRLFSNKSSL